MSVVDNAVVEMDFDNGKFQRGVAATLTALEKLKSGLKLTGATKGLQGVDDASKKISLANIASGVDNISKKFSALGIVGVTALANIATRAISTGAQMLKSLSVGPIIDGFKEYETNINSIQTILANTESSGATLTDVNKALQDLNTYSDKTIYNFSQMARNIGTFTAAGVDLKTSTASIKGIANLAALSGSNAEQASTAMYQLSQAIASGKVGLQDWNSVVNAGMGGSAFQRALAQTAVAMGKIDKNSLKLSGSMKNVTIDGQSFRDSIMASPGKESWLTSDVLTRTLQQFTGDMTDAELAAQGFSKAQIKAIQAQAKTAQDAATKVKTFSALMDTTKEAVGSGWAQTWQIVFGDFGEAKDTFTGISNMINGFVSKNSQARNQILGDWKELGGRAVLLDTIVDLFKRLGAILKPVKDAFRDIFPALTGQRLYDMTVTLSDFVAKIKLSDSALFKIRRVFQGFFAALDIGWMVLKAGVKFIVDLFKHATAGSGVFLDFAARIGDWVVALRYALKSGESLTKFFSGLEKIVLVPIEALRTLGSLIVNLFKGNSIDGASKSFGRLQARLEPFKKLGEMISRIWATVMSRLGDVFGFMAPFADAVRVAFSKIGDAIKNAISTGDFNGILDAINTGLFGGLVLVLKKFLSNGVNVDFGGGVLGTIKKSFEQLTGVLSAMQQQLKANVLLKIAGAIGILALSVGLLAIIDSAALTKSLVAISVMFVQLSAAMAVLDKITNTGGAIKLGILAGGLILLAVAIDILAIAVKTLAKLSWEELLKGLSAVVVLLAAISGTTQIMSKDAGGMIRAGIGLMAIAVAVKILASAVKDFSSMDWGSMVKGLAGVSAALGALAIFTRLASLSKIGVSSGVGLVLLAVSLKLIASAVSDFGGMDWLTLGKGFASMAVALGLIAAAVALLPGPSLVITATGLLVVSAALVIMAQALKAMGGMSWEEIGKSMVVLAGSLAILAGAMYLMEAGLPGAAAVIVMAGALAILTPVLIALGGMTWEAIGKGLATLAGVFVVLGLAGLALGPVVPILMGLGAAIALIGAGLALAGAGVFLFATGLTALSAAGAGAAVAITAIVSAIINLIPTAMKALAEGIVLFAQVIGNAAPTFLVAMTKLITTLLQAISNVAPRIISTLVNLILTLLRTIGNNIGNFVTAGVKIITGFLNGIANNIPKVVASALNVVTKFLQAVATTVPKLVDAGYKMIIDILNGVTNSINNNSEAFGRAGGNLAVAIIKGMVNGIRAGAGQVWDAARSMASDALNSVKSFLGIASPSKEMTKLGKWTSIGMADGITRYKDRVAKAGEVLGRTAINAVKSPMTKLADYVANTQVPDPVIKPSMDLSEFMKGDKFVRRTVTSMQGINIRPTYTAAATAAATRAQQAGIPTGSSTPVPGGIIFNQYNTSPKALPRSEIYRQTNNQISRVRGVLANA